MNSIEKRENVKKDYDLIADQYCDEFGVELEAKDIIDNFKSNLTIGAKVIDLGGGSGKVTKYLINNGFDAVCYDFSEKMKNNALRLFPKLPYILDDIINIKNHFNDNTVDGIVALYSLFHIPKEELKNLFYDINNVLVENGTLCFSLQLGSGESFVDEPYLKEAGKNVLYMNYVSKKEIYDILFENNFEILFEKEKREIGDNVLGEDGNDAIYIICKKNCSK